MDCVVRCVIEGKASGLCWLANIHKRDGMKQKRKDKKESVVGIFGQ